MSTETKKPKKAAPKKAQAKPLQETKLEIEESKAPTEEEVKEEPKVEEAPKSIRPTRQPKVITFEDVIKKWEALVDVLKAYLDQQQKSGKAWRHINQAHIVIKQRMLLFKRNQPE